MKRTVFLFCIMIWAATVCRAQENGTINLGGFGRGSVYGGGKDYNIASAFSELSLRVKAGKGAAFLESDIRFRTGVMYGQNDVTLDVRELYAGYKSRKFDIFLGNQIVVWGRTDGFNPTNNITPQDYFFLSADHDDQLQSNLMLRMNYRPVSGMKIEFIGIPFYKMSVYRFNLFQMGDFVHVGEDIVPEKKLKNGTLACRIDFDYPAIGGSISFFNGYDPYHGYGVTSVELTSGQPAINLASTAYRKTTVGADISVPVSNWIIRAEAAYNKTDNPDNEMFIPNSDLSYVVGLETGIAGFTIIGQYIGKYTFDFSPLPDFSLMTPPSSTDFPGLIEYMNELIDYENRLFNRKIFNQQKKTNHAASLTVTRSFAYETLSAECTAYYNFTSKELFIRPKLTWKISDTLAAAAGGNYMYGEEKTMFSYSSSILNGAFVELKVSF